jgi:hypothetical protein
VGFFWEGDQWNSVEDDVLSDEENAPNMGDFPTIET